MVSVEQVAYGTSRENETLEQQVWPPPATSASPKIYFQSWKKLREAIITGDKDLLRLGSYQGIEMQTIRDFLQRGNSSGKE